MADEAGKKVAIRRLVRGPDGKIHVVFVDAQTGKQLDSIEGYEVKDSFEQQQELLGISPTSSDKSDSKDDKSVADKVKENTVKGGNTNASDQKSQQNGDKGTPSAGRNMSNNFGFAQQPAVMNALGYMPGMVGMMGKVANVGFNVNNVAASNAARQSLGLDKLGARQTIGGVFGTNDYDDGKVADVNIGNNTYGVSFGGVSKNNMTSLTPNEARMRSMVTNQAITEATPAQAQANIDANQTSRGGLLGAIDNARGFASRALDSVFGGLWEGTKQVVTPSNRRTEPDYVGNLDTSYFPDRPSNPSGGNTSSNSFGGRVDAGSGTVSDTSIGRGIGSNGWGYSGNASNATDGGFGGSSQADHAASNPGGGLY